MAKDDPKAWMPLYLAAYERATNRLTLAEDGAYMRLIRDYWVNGPPPDDDATIARILRVERREWLKVRPALVGYFDLRDGHWFHDRVEQELSRAREIIEKRREAGRQGGRPKKQNDTKPKANGSSEEKQNETPARVALPSPLPTPDGVEDANASLSPSGDERSAYPPEFEAAWKAYPHVKGRSSKRKAHAIWRRISTGRKALLLTAVERYAREGREPKQDCGAPAMERWLRDERYLDWMQPTEAKAAVSSTWNGPDEVRAAVEAGFGDPGRALSFLSRCSWDAERKAIVSENSFTVETIRREAGPWLARLGVKLIQGKGRAA